MWRIEEQPFLINHQERPKDQIWHSKYWEKPLAKKDAFYFHRKIFSSIWKIQITQL